MIRALSFLLFVSVATIVLADTQKCDDKTTYTSFIGELQDGQTTADYCICMQKYLEAKGLLKGKKYACREHPNINTLLTIKTSPYKEDTGCDKCLGGCQNVNYNPSNVCAAINAAERGIVLPRKVPSTQALAKRIIIIVIIVVRPDSVTIYIGVYIG